VVSLQMCSFEGFLHTNYKLVGRPRYHRNPIKGMARLGKSIIWILQSTCVKFSASCTLLISMWIIKWSLNWKYCISLFNQENVVGDQYDNFGIDNNCNLVRGWSKYDYLSWRIGKCTTLTSNNWYCFCNKFCVPNYYYLWWS